MGTPIRVLLLTINNAVEQAGGALSPHQGGQYKRRDRGLLKQAEIECPPPPPDKTANRGRSKRSTTRNLLERLIEYESDVLRFMDNPMVPFTNHRGENDRRMTKVQQKISGCFRSPEGARMFCRIRGYLSTCRKQSVSAAEAMRRVFDNKMPGFV